MRYLSALTHRVRCFLSPTYNRKAARHDALAALRHAESALIDSTNTLLTH